MMNAGMLTYAGNLNNFEFSDDDSDEGRNKSSSSSRPAGDPKSAAMSKMKGKCTENVDAEILPAVKRLTKDFGEISRAKLEYQVGRK